MVLDRQFCSPHLESQSFKFWNIAGDSSFLLNKASALKTHIKHPE